MKEKFLFENRRRKLLQKDEKGTKYHIKSGRLYQDYLLDLD